MKPKAKKIIIITACILAAVLILTPLSYLLYVVTDYERIEDNLPLEVWGDTGRDYAPVGQTLSLVSYNIGFGAYSADYSFFMDGGEHSRAYSKEAVTSNTQGAIYEVMKEAPTFALFQEVDTDGTRSYHVDQSAMLKKAFGAYSGAFAQNYNSPYFLYPFNEPIGANQSGIVTLSSFNIQSSLRRSLPIENSFYKYLDLDRAYSASVIKTSNGKNLVLYNVHLSAYTSDGTIADEQMKMLAADMEAEYKKGNYVIAAGDFNKDMLGDSSKYFERIEGEEFNWAKPFDTSLLPSGFSAHTGSNLPTCRNADSPYKGDGTDFVLSVDGILTSPNVEVKLCETLDVDFAYSDHNPVKMEFVLKR